MNSLTRERAKELIRELRIPSFFLNVIDEKVSPPLDMYFGCPTLYYLNSEEQEAYHLGDILPLWEDGGGYMQYAYDIENRDYIAFDIEGGEPSRYSWDELVRSVIDTLIEHEFEEQENLEYVLAEIRVLLKDLDIKNFNKIAENIIVEWSG